MTAKEKYDAIIDEIEELATKWRMSAIDIAGTVADKFVMSVRDMGTILGFLTNEKLINYIRSRKYQAAYAYLIGAKDDGVKCARAIDKALTIADIYEQSSLNRVFKKLFGINPGEAYYLQDPSRMSPPKSWDEISHDVNVEDDIEESTPEMETIFGIDIAIYERITLINDLQAAYGLNREYSVLAVHLADEHGIDMNAAFGYVEGFKAARELIIDDEEASKELVAEMLSDEWLWKKATDPAMIFCCIKCGVSVSSALWVIDELPELGHSPVTEMSPFFIRAFREGHNIHSHFLRKACEYYERHIDDTYSDEDFEEFIDRLNMDRPIEIAFEEMQYEKACNDSDDDIFTIDLHEDDAEVDVETEAFEAWAEREAGNHGPRFDDYYDPDNPSYY